MPGFEEAERLNRELGKIGNLKGDGRPILGLDSKELLKITLDISTDSILIPAHAWTPHFSVFGSRSGFNSLKDLLEPGIKIISIANPSHAPYGMVAKEAMERTGVWEKVKDRVVFGENIRQVLQYLETGSVDAAIIALSVSIGSDVNYTLIPQELHSPIEQAMGVIKGAKNQKAAREFADFISGPKGRPIMKKYGFVLPHELQ